jgi:hypothetical protein
MLQLIRRILGYPATPETEEPETELMFCGLEVEAYLPAQTLVKEDKRTFDRDLNIEVKGGKYVG